MPIFEHAGSDRDRARTSGRAAYATARLGPGDIDVVELYDAFTPSHSTRSFSARSRLLPERGAGPFVSDGHFELGRPALNPNGGPLPYAIPACTERSCDRGGATATP
jgi:acetyl-CoA acetyltransferase